MLPAANRLRSAADFTDTTRRGAKASRGSVVVYVRRHDSVEPPRVGLIVTKAVGGSVVRHRAARRIRAAMAPLVSTLPPGLRVVIRALPGADLDPRLVADLQTSVAAAVERVR